MAIPTIYALCVFIHIVAACAWVGSLLFFSAVVVPALRRSRENAAAGELLRLVGLRFRIFGWICIGTLVVTGAVNLGLRGVGWATLTSGPFWAAGFGQVLAYKLAAVVVVIALTAAHDALSLRPSARRLASWLGRLTLLASLIVVLCAVWLVRGMP